MVYPLGTSSSQTGTGLSLSALCLCLHVLTGHRSIELLSQAWCTGQGMCLLCLKGQVTVDSKHPSFLDLPMGPPWGVFIVFWSPQLPTDIHINTLCIGSVPSQFYLLFPTLDLPRIISPISYLHLNSCFRVCFWGNSTCFHDLIHKLCPTFASHRL